MRKVKCILSTKCFDKKPEKYEISSIVIDMKKDISKYQYELSVEELAIGMAKGQTFKPALLNGTKSDSWIQQEMFALDFDHNVTIDEQLKKCSDLNIIPAFGYTSFSHTEQEHKFRLVFVTDKIITNLEERHRLQITLMDIFKESDEVTFDCTRWFYGGRKLIYQNYDATINNEDIINTYFNQDYFEERMKHFLSKNKTTKKSKKLQSNIDAIKDNIKSSRESTNRLININILSNLKVDNDNYNIKAINTRNVEYFKNKFNSPLIICENNQDFFDIVFSIDIGELLGIGYSRSFNCIFHEENSPSATIYKNDEGRYFYKCHSVSCGVSYNILNVIERLGNYKSRPKAYKFIKEIFNIQIQDTDWQKEQREILKANLDLFLNQEFEALCPTTYNNIRRSIPFIMMMHHIAMNHITNEKYSDEEGNIIFYSSMSNVCKQLGMSEQSTKRISQKSVLMQYHKLLNKIDAENSNNEIVQKIVDRSQAINSKKKQSNKHITIYSIPSYTTNKLEEIEESGKRWVNNSYNMTGCSREMFYRTEGLEVANELYPQHKRTSVNHQIVDRTTSKQSDEKTIKIVEIIMKHIDQKGYATERLILEDLVGTYYKNATKIQIKKSLKEICDSYDLKVVTANREIKEKYNINSNGHPKVIIKND